MSGIMVGLSGGVDSAAAAVLLREQGEEVSGVTLVLRDSEAAQADVESAAKIASFLDIPHYVLDLRQKFESAVIAPFISEYSAGRTPNPCVLCNEAIKFGAMLDFALSKGADKIATGHYAVISQDETGLPILKRSPGNKDQSYFLYRLNTFQLSHAVFPLQQIEDKQIIRNICAGRGLEVAKRGDSQEICFVPGDDYISFLLSRGVKSEPGDFTDKSGAKIGTHSGIIRYTVGQRKGLGAFGKPMFVTRIDAENSRVVLGENGEQYSRGFIADSLSLIGGGELPASLTAQVKIRFRAAPCTAHITPLPGGSFRAEFEEPQRSVTPGQAAVIYIGDTVLGGGRIITQLD